MTLLRTMIVGTVILTAVILLGTFAFNIDMNVPTEDFQRLMTQEGIQSPVKGNYASGVCSEDDSYNSTFTGTKNGVSVSGVLCKGVTKGYTIRYF